jgi:hypothetical protein
MVYGIWYGCGFNRYFSIEEVGLIGRCHIVYGVWCTVYGVWYMVYGIWCMGVGLIGRYNIPTKKERV